MDDCHHYYRYDYNDFDDYVEDDKYDYNEFDDNMQDASNYGAGDDAKSDDPHECVILDSGNEANITPDGGNKTGVTSYKADTYDDGGKEASSNHDYGTHKGTTLGSNIKATVFEYMNCDCGCDRTQSTLDSGNEAAGSNSTTSATFDSSSGAAGPNNATCNNTGKQGNAANTAGMGNHHPSTTVNTAGVGDHPSHIEDISDDV